MVKVIYQILHTKKNRSSKAGKAVYGITMENLRNRIDL